MRRAPLLFLLLLVFPVLSEVRFGKLNDDIVTHYEQLIKKELQEKKASPAEYYKHYMEAAESLMAYGYYQYANKYFIKASESEVAELRAYVRALSTFKLLEKKVEYENWIKITDNFIKKNQVDKKSRDYQYYMFEKSLHPIEHAKKYFKNGEYGKSLAILKKIDMKKASLPMKVFSDLNNVLAGKRKEKLLCKKDFDRFPASPSYSIKICKSLLAHSRGKRFDSDFEWIKKEIETNYPQQNHLLYGLKSLGGTQ